MPFYPYKEVCVCVWRGGGELKWAGGDKNGLGHFTPLGNNEGDEVKMGWRG